MSEFSRTERLIGTEKLKELAGISITVFGVGGVGSHCVEALARCGVGRLILIDNDKVSLSNINRQSIASHSTLNRPKVEVMKERILDINPSARVKTWETFVLPDNLKTLMDASGPVDYIIDAIDTVAAKLAIAAFALENDIPLISSMGTGNKLDSAGFQVADIHETSMCPLAKVIRKELRARGITDVKVVYSKEEPLSTGQRTPASISFVPPVAGLIMDGEVVKDLIDSGDAKDERLSHISV